MTSQTIFEQVAGLIDRAEETHTGKVLGVQKKQLVKDGMLLLLGEAEYQRFLPMIDATIDGIVAMHNTQPGPTRIARLRQVLLSCLLATQRG